MSEHTELPWFCDDSAICGGGGVIARLPNHPENGLNWKKDAAHIIKCVNSHEAMVTAAQTVLDGLNARMDQAAAAQGPVPVFEGIAALHCALASIKT